jgi:hypothetical protein
MGRSLTFVQKSFGGTVFPPPVHRKTVYLIALLWRFDAGRRGIRRKAQRITCIDIPAFKP